MTRFQFKPESGKKQKRADKRERDREESGRDDRFPRERRGETRRPGSKPAGRGPRSSGAPVKDAFSALIRDTAHDLGLGDRLDPEPAPLALLAYDDELKLKNASIRAWWAHHQIPDKPTLVVPSPLPRHYRSTTKRRLVRKGDAWRWDFFLERLGGTAKAGIDSLEPASHAAVYKRALEKLNEDAYRGLASSLNFLIVRGDADLMVIFNVFRLNAEVVRKAKLLGEHLAQIKHDGGQDDGENDEDGTSAAAPARRHAKGAKVAKGAPHGAGAVVAAHVFYDKTRSDYYLEARVSEGAFRLKRLFGPEFLPVTVDGRRFLLHPTGFFQVNPSILPRVIAETTGALKPRAGDRLLDLYCGCGLFTLPVAAQCAAAYGIEGSPASIEAAQKAAGAADAATRRNTRFAAARIDAKSLTRLLPPADDTPEIILLDPPRQGTAPGVIPLLAQRRPRRVAYLFCDMNTMPVEINKWRKHGYMVAKAMPFDMFPGTNNLEVLVVLIPDQYGLLGRKKPKVEAVDEEESAVDSGRSTVKTKRGESSRSGYVPKSRAGHNGFKKKGKG